MAVVTEVPLSEAVASCNSTEPMNVNFYDFLGTNGCLLNCEERKQLQSALSVQPRLGNAGDFKKKKEIRKSAREGSEGHFTLHDLATSIEKGCRSCKVLHSILEYVSLIRPEDVSNDTNVLFNVTASFVLSRRLGPVDNTTTTSEEIRLFHPHIAASKLIWLIQADHFKDSAGAAT
ncbi:heterokaryon incompatibility protein-domain-containing protein [Venturia nashicola]|uniref:Heterokaryon incompatibility protein-domain-containing protein n=1 Tax=Venturia nashicola TaxID=86259 RepID=A0A4Z1NZ99_9PEZI|nr:heterokaryon incompatibility protein-domain-containing protein [Venturia nashicola]